VERPKKEIIPRFKTILRKQEKPQRKLDEGAQEEGEKTLRDRQRKEDGASSTLKRLEAERMKAAKCQEKPEELWETWGDRLENVHQGFEL